MPARSRRRRQIRRALVTASGLSLALAICFELIFGNWIFGQNYGTLEVTRDVEHEFDTAGVYDGGNIRYERDKHGLRGTYERPSRIDILAVGGGTTDEALIGEGKTWTDILAAGLARMAGRRVAVVNAGVDGQSTAGTIRNFEQWFPKIPGLRPRYVLAYLGLDDMAVMTSDQAAEAARDNLGATESPAAQYFRNNSAFHAVYRKLFGEPEGRASMPLPEGKKVEGTFVPLPEPLDLAATASVYAEALDAYAARLRTLSEMIRKLGAEPIFATQHAGDYRVDKNGDVLGRPTADGAIDTGHFALLTLINWRTMTVCEEVRAICVDLAETLRFKDGDHYDAIHTTPRGSAKVGRALYEALKDRLQFSETARLLPN